MRTPDKERLIEFHRTYWSSTWVWLGFAAAFTVGQAALLWILLREGPWWLAAILIVVVAHIMHSHLIAFHEAAHGSLCPQRHVNDAIGMFIGVPSLMIFSLYRAVHHSHHAYIGSERDEEMWPFAIPGMPRWFRRLMAAAELIFGLFYTPFLFLRAFLRHGTPVTHAPTRRRVWIEIAALSFIWTAIVAAAAWWHGWQYLIVLWLIPALLAGSMQSVRKYIEHVGLLGASVLDSTRTIIPENLPAKLLSFSLFHEPYHGVHHKYARLPHAALPEFTSVLEAPAGEEEGPLYPNYRSAFYDMVRSLRDPKVGAQWLRGAGQNKKPLAA
jgi:fatty acid desaturase